MKSPRYDNCIYCFGSSSFSNSLLAIGDFFGNEQKNVSLIGRPVFFI